VYESTKGRVIWNWRQVSSGVERSWKAFGRRSSGAPKAIVSRQRWEERKRTNSGESFWRKKITKVSLRELTPVIAGMISEAGKGREGGEAKSTRAAIDRPMRINAINKMIQ
jgi:hypothetical protein